MRVVLHTQHGANLLQDAHTLQLCILGALRKQAVRQQAAAAAGRQRDRLVQ
jgi:hypothetical protein